MPDTTELLVGFLSETLKTDAESLKAELFEQEGDEVKIKDSAKDYLLTLDKQRIKSVADTHYKNAYAKAKKEERSAFESEIKSQFGIDSEKFGVDLIADIVQAKAKPGEPLTDDAVKKHPLFLTREQQLQKEKADAIKELETRYKVEKYAETFNKEALQEFKALKPVLSPDAAKAENQLDLFKKVIAETKYEVNNGQVVLLNSDGTGRLEDDHGNAVTLADHVRKVASKYFDFEQSDKRTSGDDPAKKKGDGSEGLKLTKPKDQAEFTKMSAQIRETYASDRKVMNEKLQELITLYRS